MLVGEWLSKTAGELEKAGIKSAKLDALILLEYSSGKERSALLADLHLPIVQSDNLAQLVKKRLQHQPIAYLVCSKEFYGLGFKVTPDTLIPRPESEAIVEYAESIAPGRSQVLDIGTGCGNLAVSLKASRPDLTVTASDISPKALIVAEQNAKRHGVAIKFVQSDLVDKIKGRYQLVMANLPYLASSTPVEQELTYEPSTALFAGSAGLDTYRRLAEELETNLTEKAVFIIEHEPSQLATITTLYSKYLPKRHNISRFVTAFARI